MPQDRTYRAGVSLEDYCRVCKTDRMHTVIAADDEGTPLRVSCGYCHSEHNYRGGPRVPQGAGVRGAAGRHTSSHRTRLIVRTVSHRE